MHHCPLDGNIYLHPPEYIFCILSSESAEQTIFRRTRLSSMTYIMFGPGGRHSESGRWPECLSQLAIRLGHFENFPGVQVPKLVGQPLEWCLTLVGESLKGSLTLVGRYA